VQPHQIRVYLAADGVAPPPPPTPTPALVPTPTAQPAYGACPALISDALGWAGCAVSFCESGYDWGATGKAGERGAFQIHPVHAGPGGLIAQLGYTWDDMYLPGPNAHVATVLSNYGNNWGPWSVRSVLATGICPNGDEVPM
jgi:hypothetical protein